MPIVCGRGGGGGFTKNQICRGIAHNGGLGQVTDLRRGLANKL